MSPISAKYFKCLGFLALTTYSSAACALYCVLYLVKTKSAIVDRALLDLIKQISHNMWLKMWKTFIKLYYNSRSILYLLTASFAPLLDPENKDIELFLLCPVKTQVHPTFFF